MCRAEEMRMRFERTGARTVAVAVREVRVPPRHRGASDVSDEELLFRQKPKSVTNLREHADSLIIKHVRRRAEPSTSIRRSVTKTSKTNSFVPL